MIKIYNNVRVRPWRSVEILAASMTTWNAVYDSNTSNDFASTLAAVGPGQTLVNGWVDLAGSTWKTSGLNRWISIFLRI